MSTSNIRASKPNVPRRGGVSRLAPLLLAVVFAWGGVVKLIDPDAFGFTLWKVFGGLVSPHLAVWLGGSWAVLELGVAFTLFARPRSRYLLRVTIALCLIFIGVLLRLLLMTDPPGCGCLSIATPRAGAFELELGLLRNIGLIWLASLGLRASVPWPLAPASRPRTAPSGFTLIETLVVIAVILVLIGLLLPSIERTFFSAKHTRQAIRQRETYVALMAYTEDHKSGFPYFGTVGEPFRPCTVNGVVLGENYFASHLWFWGTLLVPKYVPQRSMLESDFGTEAMRNLDERLIYAESVLTGTALAAPAYFRNYIEGEQLDFSHFRGTRTHEVLFPSDKIVLISWWGGGGVPKFAHGQEHQYPSTFADGATTQFSYDELIALPTAIVPLGGGIPTHTTYGGLRGRDR